jgi:transcriptional regulator with XRE-family HTH domain
MNVGDKIKNRRKALGMSLRALAEQSDLTASYLSQVERNVSMPSIDSLRKISKALNIPTFYFFLETENPSPVVRRGERRQLLIPQSHVIYELLTPNVNRKMEIILAELQPTSGAIPLIHHENTEECILVLEGQLEVQVAGETYQLKTGDTIYFEGVLLQRIAAVGDSKVRYLSIVTPPIF